MDFYNEDGDSNIDYSNQADFYSGNPTQQPELEFQSFDASETEGVPQPTTGDIELEDFSDSQDAPKAPKRAPGEGKFWQLSFYQHIADVDTMDVLKRLGSACFPLKDFFALISGNPDLYGWFWVATTLVFTLAAAGNFASYLTYAVHNRLDDWSYDFAKLGVGATLVYLYVTICPFLAFVAVKLWLELGPGILDHFCVYGYSLFPYILAAIVMIVPNLYARWVIIILACALVCGFLIRNYYPLVRSRPAEGAGIIIAIVIFNILFALILQFFFFQYFVESPPDDSSSSSNISPSDSTADYSSANASSGDTSVDQTSYEEEDPSPSPSESPIAESLTPTPSVSVEVESVTPTGTPSPTISFVAASASPSPVEPSPSPQDNIPPIDYNTQ